MSWHESTAVAVVGVIARAAVLLDAVALVCIVHHVKRFAQLVLADLAAVGVELGVQGAVEDGTYSLLPAWFMA